MNIEQELNTFISNIDTAGAGYKSWGTVAIQRIAVREGKRICVTPSDSSLSSAMGRWLLPVGNSDEDKMIAAIFAKRSKINCIIITHQEYASTVKDEIPPILDDQAQLLGVSVRVADASKIASALSSRFAAVCSDGRCICIGGTVEDAYIAAQLLEKTSKAWQEAKYLGGAKSINRFEAWAMQMYYQFKYAKEAKKNK